MSNGLPLESLRHLKDLSLKFYCASGHAPHWPDTWDQLTSITRLEMDVWTHAPNGPSITYFLLPLRIKSLVKVSLTAHYDIFDKSGEEYLLALSDGLPVLSRLKIAIVNFPKKPDGPLEIKDANRLLAICKAVQSRNPGLEYAIFEGEEREAYQLLLCKFVYPLQSTSSS